MTLSSEYIQKLTTATVIHAPVILQRLFQYFPIWFPNLCPYPFHSILNTATRAILLTVHHHIIPQLMEKLKLLSAPIESSPGKSLMSYPHHSFCSGYTGLCDSLNTPGMLLPPGLYISILSAQNAFLQIAFLLPLYHY